MSIHLEGLTKRYGHRIAVDDLSLAVKEGEIYGFLGPNGAGKSTTIRMSVGILQPDAGRVSIAGTVIHSRNRNLGARRLFGVVSEHQYLYDGMTVRDYLHFFADLYGAARSRVGVVLEEVGLQDRAHDQATALSKGLQQKLGLARALVHDPVVLILDEPVSGLDPSGLIEVRELLNRERNRGKSILVSSHVLSEIERSADRVGIISEGRLIHEGNISELVARVKSGTSINIEVDSASPVDLARLESLPFVDAVEISGEGRIRIHLIGEDDRIELSRSLNEMDVVITGMTQESTSLEDVFVALTKAQSSRASREGENLIADRPLDQ